VKQKANDRRRADGIGYLSAMSSATIAMCQFRPTKGSVNANLDRIVQVMHDAVALPAAPSVLVFPEAMLTGYFLEGGVHEHARDAGALFHELERRHSGAGLPPVDICLGFYEAFQNTLYNSVGWFQLGGEGAGVRHVHRKVFLPTYGVFDEERFVEAGHDVRAFDTRLGRVAMLVCEDAWHSLSGTIAAVDGAQLVVVVAASPARGLVPDALHPGQPNSLVRWNRLAQDMASEHGIFVVLTQLVGFEGGKGFPGGSIAIGPDGATLGIAPLFDDALVPVTLDFSAIARTRAASPLLADLRLKLPDLAESLMRARNREGASRSPAATPVPISAAALVPAAVRSCVLPSLSIDPELTARWLIEFLRDEIRRRRGFERVIVGVSGGIDSAVVATLAVRALGAEQVHAVRMPYRTSSAEAAAHARLVTEALGIDERTVDISAAVDGYAAAAGVVPSPQRLGNVMARIRMTALFDLGAALDALPLGTGNKSERLLGYFTWHGDDAPPVNPIGDLYKTQLRQLATYLDVPAVIVDKPATADLVANQTDEADLGISYERADPVLELLLRGYSETDITAAGCAPDEVALVARRLNGTHWKRRTASVAMLSQTAIGDYYLRPVDY
jgi:NAD+ synthase (glutamine-hydrolysing)